jgi:hypothetical protein
MHAWYKYHKQARNQEIGTCMNVVEYSLHALSFFEAHKYDDLHPQDGYACHTCILLIQLQQLKLIMQSVTQKLESAGET